MNKQDFSVGMMKLLSHKNWKNSYPAEVLDLVYREVQTLTSEDFSKVTTHIIGTCASAPLVPGFRKAINELGIKIKTSTSSSTPQPAAASSPQGHIYHLRDNLWADDNYIYRRGPTVKECGFIIKKNFPDHPLVIEDSEVRADRLKAIGNATKSIFQSQTARKVDGMQTLAF